MHRVGKAQTSDRDRQLIPDESTWLPHLVLPPDKNYSEGTVGKLPQFLINSYMPKDIYPDSEGMKNTGWRQDLARSERRVIYRDVLSSECRQVQAKIGQGLGGILQKFYY